MEPDSDDLVGTQARLYFLHLSGWVRDLHRARLAVVSAFTSLLREYDEVFPRCRLQLYSKCRPLHGPTALYWGEISTVRLAHSGLGNGETRRRIKHKKGAFRAEWSFTIAKHSDRVARFQDFNRRRLALNSAHQAVSGALVHLGNATLRKFPVRTTPVLLPSGLDPELRKEVPDVPEGLLPSELPPRLLLALRSGWVCAYSLALAEDEAWKLSQEVRGNPSVKNLRLEISERRKASFSRDIRWISSPTETAYPKLTDRRMRLLHLPEGVRPVLSLKELKRRRIEKALDRSAAALDSIRKRCEKAQVEVSAGIAEARSMFLSEVSSRDSSDVRTAS